MSDEATTAVTVAFDGEVATIALNRPERRNAMSGALVAELTAEFQRLDAVESVRAIVLRGEGGGFCAGSDLAHLASLDAFGKGEFEARSGEAAELIRTLDTPVVAAVHGFAIGGGLTLAAACDIVVTAPTAKWALPEVPIGLFPAWGLASVERRVGETRARRLSYGIDTLDGTAAVAWGLADELAEEPLVRAHELAAALAALPRPQSAFVKHYFSSPDRADPLARDLFDAAVATEVGAATVVRFSKGSKA